MNYFKTPGGNKFVLMGLVLAVLGVLALASPAVAGTAVVYVIGGMLLLAGLFQVIAAWRSEGWADKMIPAIMGVLTALAGGAVLAHPILGLEFLALMLAIFFVIDGVWKIVASFSYRPAPGWIAVLLSGVIALALGGMIWKQWPVSGENAVGILVGVDLLSTGIAFLILGLTIRRMKHLLREVAKEQGFA